MKKIIYIFALALMTLALGACGPKPKVVSENLTKAELQEDELPPAAFQHYISGVIAEEEENYELALNYYTNALKYAPESYEIRVALANLRMGMRQYQEAWDLLQPLDDIYAESVLMKADIQRSLGNWDEAIKYYRLGARLDPTNMAPYWYLGNYFSRTDDLQQAIWNYRRLAQLNTSSQVLNDLGNLYVRSGDTALAIETYHRSVQSEPSTENRDAYLELAKLLGAAGQRDSAQIILNEYVKVSAGSIDARLQLIESYIASGQKKEALDEIANLAAENPNRSRLLGQLGAMCIDLNEIEMAKRLFGQQAGLDPQDFFPQYYLGRIAIFENHFEEAKGHFWKVVDLVDSLPDGWINLAEIYRAQDSLEMSVDVLREGMDRVSVGKKDLQIYMARYYAQMEKYQSVVNVLEGLADSSCIDINVLFSLASAYERLGHFGESVTEFERVLKLNPDFHPALNYLGYMYADSGIQLVRARDMIEKALAQDSLNPAYLDSYGWVLFKMGKLSDAEKYIRKALDLTQPADAVLYDHLAEIYFAQGRREDARIAWQKALGIDPNNIAIKEKLER